MPPLAVHSLSKQTSVWHLFISLSSSVKLSFAYKYKMFFTRLIGQHYYYLNFCLFVKFLSYIRINNRKRGISSFVCSYKHFFLTQTKRLFYEINCHNHNRSQQRRKMVQQRRDDKRRLLNTHLKFEKGRQNDVLSTLFLSFVRLFYHYKVFV